MDNKNFNLVNTMEESILSVLGSTKSKNISWDQIEDFYDNPIWDFIPIIKFAKYVFKTGLNINERHEVKKIMCFFSRLVAGNIAEHEIAKRRAAYSSNEKWFYDEVENIVVFIMRSPRMEKVKVQSELYIDYLNGLITNEAFLEYLEILDSMIVSDFNTLIDIYNSQVSLPPNPLDPGNRDILKGVTLEFDANCSRLAACGLVSMLSMGMNFAITIPNNYIITDIGRYFSQIILRSRSN